MFSLDRRAKFGIFRGTFPLGVLWAVCFVSGCNNTCIFGVVNPPNNSVAVAGGNSVATTCSQAPITGVTVGGNLVGGCTNCASSEQVSHAYLVVSGIEFHPSALADLNSPDWQEVAPGLAQHPRLVDLVVNSASGEVAFPLEVSGTMPAGEYYKARLKLAEASTLPQSNADLLATKACASTTGSGCLVNANGSVHELRTLDGQPFVPLQVANPIDLLAGRENRIQLQFRPEWLLEQTSRGLELVPVLDGEMGAAATAALAK